MEFQLNSETWGSAKKAAPSPDCTVTGDSYHLEGMLCQALVLNILCILTHLILQPLGKCYYQPHFVSEKLKQSDEETCLPRHS